MKVNVYGALSYDRGAKVRWLLDELELRYENIWLNMSKGENESESYLKLNPLGRVPTVTFDGAPMIESSAICAYLADQYLDKGLAPALNSELRRAYQQWMHFSNSVDSFTTRISIIEDIPPGEVMEQKMSALLTEVKDYVRFLGDSLKGRDYLVEAFSAADICLGYHLYIASLWPELNEIIESNDNVSGYLKRLKARPAAQKSRAFSYGE